ncbi:PF13754 domain-containing protein [Crassaminicella profunda]|uniref:PF13754 domain-containing protein n=1 Tax=Crassaminicella profunda TaxID=1286698 RepID=UPI001CA78B19|nr:PF13754 domain-containing protein [Crassaminicella profunda]QZY56721.1 PF13754 domain-containing protein [Crassaminicella profunda]
MKLIGYIDGVEVKFDFNPPNQFKAIIPKQLDGIYVLELHVIDQAGNRTNLTNMIVTIDFDKLMFEILEENYSDQMLEKDYSNRNLEKNYINQQENNDFEFRKLQQEYSFKELV